MPTVKPNQLFQNPHTLRITQNNTNLCGNEDSNMLKHGDILTLAKILALENNAILRYLTMQVY